MVEKKVKKKSRETVIDEQGRIIVGLRKLRKQGGAYYLGVPKEYVERHGLREGDVVPLVGNYVLKYVPVEREEREEKRGRKRMSKEEVEQGIVNYPHKEVKMRR